MSLHLHLAEGLVPVPAARRSPCLLADHDAAARALGLEPGADVQRVADEVGVAGPDHDFAGVHRHAQRQLDSMRVGDLGSEVDEALLQRNRGVDGVGGVVGSDLGNTPDRHEPVADVLHDARMVTLRGRPQDIVVVADHLARRLGVDPLFETGRPGQIGEHDRHGLASGARAGDIVRYLTVEGRAASAAEPRRRIGFHAAGRTDSCERSAAALAEASVLFIRRTASGADTAVFGHRQSGLSDKTS